MDVDKPAPKQLPWNRFYWLGIPASFLLVIAACYLYLFLLNDQAEHIVRHLQDARNIVVKPMELTLEAHIKSLQRMVRRLELMGEGSATIAFWYKDATSYYQDGDIYEALEIVDNQHRIQEIVPQQLQARYQGLDLSKLPGRNQAFAAASQAQGPYISNVFNLFAGPLGFLVIIPIKFNQQSINFLVGSVNVEKLFKRFLKGGFSEHYGIAVYQNEKPIYAIGDVVNPYYITSQKLRLFNIEWTVYIWPTAKLINEISDPLPIVALCCLTLFAILVLIIFYYYQRSLMNSFFIEAEKAKAEELSFRLKSILDNVNEGFVSIDAKGYIFEMNSYAEKILGWRKEEVVGKNAWRLFIPERFQQLHFDGVKEFIKKGSSPMLNREIQFLARTKSGREFPVEVIIFPILSQGKFTFHSFIRDITQRKRIEADQARYRAIINSSDDAIISSDLSGMVTTWNQGAHKLLGYTEEEMIGQSVSTYYPESELDKLRSILDKLGRGEHVMLPDAKRKHKNGEVIPVSVIISPIVNSNGKSIGITSITRDIRELKKIDKMKNEFISIVSHELRTPLTSIRGAISLLASGKMGKFDAKGEKLLDIANNNCERLIRLINDILDIEKIEAGKMDFVFKVIDLLALIKEAIESNQSLAEKSKVNINLTAPETVHVQGDYDKLTQVITNLLSNAIRFSPENGEILVKIKQDNDHVSVCICDQGPGIPKAFQHKIFQKFTQADSSDTRKMGGTGLGLSISKAIIEKHHGKIGFNTSDKGSEFYFELPLITSIQSDKALNHNLLLICADKGKVLENFKSFLSKKSINTHIAHSAQEAKKLLRQHHYIAVAIDLLLPDENGINLIKKIRKESHTQEIPLMVISIKETDKDPNFEADAFPILDWIEKPVKPEDFKELSDLISKTFNDKRPKILSVEDDFDIQSLVKLLLEEKADIMSVTNISDARRALVDHDFDLVILDLNLPDGYGTTLLPCYSYKSHKLIPVVVFSIDELDEKYIHLVKNHLVKSITSNEQLLRAIDSILEKPYESEKTE